MVYDTSREDQYDFHEELLINLFQNPNVSDFAYNTLNTLDNSRRSRRHDAFNVILIDNIDLLRYTYIIIRPTFRVT